jgi:UDP-N-acetylmuramate dehydrogenase
VILDDVYEALAARAHGAVKRNAPLAPMTTYQLGGPAAVLLEASSTDDLRALADAVAGRDVPLLFVGRGSNMLVADPGYPGVAVRLGAGFRWTRVDGPNIAAGGGVPVPALAMLAADNRLTGFEFAVAIPASLGGAVRMNAGAHGHSMSDILADAAVFDLNSGNENVVAGSDLGFAYRTSALPPRVIVTAATLALRTGEPAEIKALMDEARTWRRETQPAGVPNAGSVFRNPPGDAAGRLVETICGKGMRAGGARVSEVHANFIVTEPGATAADVLALIRRIQRMVHEAAGIRLETEVELVGDFEEVGDGTTVR